MTVAILQAIYHSGNNSWR